MKRSTTLRLRVTLQVLLFFTTIAFLSSCASMNQYTSKFTKSTTANVAFFADNTIALIGDADIGLTKDDAIYTREFFNRSEREEQLISGLLSETKRLLHAIVNYSVRIVTISETALSEADRIKQYADFLDTLEDWVEKNLDLKDTHYKTVIENVRVQETFMGALHQAQPIISALGRYAELLIEEIDVATEALVYKIDTKIDAKYKGVVVYHDGLRKGKFKILEALKYVDRSFRGFKGAFDMVLDTQTIRNQKLLPAEGQSPTEEQLRAIGKHLFERLDNIDRIEKEIDNDWVTYRATHAELDRKHDELIAQSNRARLLFLVWARAHRKMSSGVVAPAEWFDISDVPAKLFRLGTSALPVPGL
jgi:hypothetical protein